MQPYWERPEWIIQHTTRLQTIMVTPYIYCDNTFLPRATKSETIPGLFYTCISKEIFTLDSTIFFHAKWLLPEGPRDLYMTFYTKHDYLTAWPTHGFSLSVAIIASLGPSKGSPFAASLLRSSVTRIMLKWSLPALFLLSLEDKTWSLLLFVVTAWDSCAVVRHGAVCKARHTVTDLKIDLK